MEWDRETEVRRRIAPNAGVGLIVADGMADQIASDAFEVRTSELLNEPHPASVAAKRRIANPQVPSQRDCTIAATESALPLLRSSW